ncbi:MAG TPA: diguanylate cyclase [Burkholderiales bacterium]|nr:diguanylate cyclase [Burkholderiales bacterium]
MTDRDFSELSQAQILEILVELQHVMESRGKPLPMVSQVGGPSKLESALMEKQSRRSFDQNVTAHPRLLAAIVEASPDAITSRTLDGVLLTWNKGAERMFGFTAQEAIGRNHEGLFESSRKAEIEEINDRLMRGESIIDLETVRVRKDGSLKNISVNISPIMEAGQVVRVCSIARDIDARKVTEKALHDALARERQRASELAAVLDAVPAVVLIAHDRHCERITGNRAASETLRMALGANMSKNPRNDGRPAHFRVRRGGKDLSPDEFPVERAAREGIDIRGFEEEIAFDDGTVTHLIGNAKPLLNQAGEIYGAVAAFVDISARKDAEDRIRQLAHLDPLTRLPNRILLMDRIEQALAISQRNQARAGVIFLDLDNFKDINDRHGHHMGDQLLQRMAERIRESIREADTVSRLGGDEFIVVLPELRDVSDADVIAAKMLDVVGEQCILAGQRIRVTASLGISIFPDHGRDAETLIRHADQAMYDAKESGRNTHVVYGAPPGRNPD